MKASAPITEAFAVKTREGVTLYADADRRRVIEHWPYYRTSCPSPRMRYLHAVKGATYRLLWQTI